MTLQWDVDAEGVIRIAGTRVSFDTVVASLDVGATTEEIVRDIPVLKAADVDAVREFYLQHRADMEEYLRKQVRVPEKVQRMMQALSRNSKLWLPN